MDLPKRPSTTYHTQLPSDKKKRISFHPFLVREQKAMLVAQESLDDKIIFSTVKNVVQSCLETPIRVNDMFVFDFEHLFLKIREVSVGEFSRLRFFCQNPSCQENDSFVEIDVDLREVKTEKIPGHTSLIDLSDSVSQNLRIQMRYMTVQDLDVLDDDDAGDLEGIFNMVARCVEAVYEGDTKYDGKDFTVTQMKEFLESLTSEQFQKIETFFETCPRPKLVVKYVCPVCKTEQKESLEGLKSFF